jgi:hypothetical protein
MGTFECVGESCEELVCGEDEFLCVDLTQCIHDSFVCDKVMDCLDASDEYNCSKKNKFQS